MVSGAENLPGLKRSTEDADRHFLFVSGDFSLAWYKENVLVVEEHFQCGEGQPGRVTGALGRENVGMSNPLSR